MRSFGGATRGLGAHAGPRHGVRFGGGVDGEATAKTFDYQLALEEAIDFPVQTIERYTPLAEKHGLHLQHYEMRDLHIHDLRRTLGSWLASSGTSLPIIGRVLNHKTPEATKVYARLIVAPVRNAMEEATAAMRKIGEQ